MLVETSWAPLQAQLNSLLSNCSGPALDEVTEQVFQDLLDEVTLGIAFEMHR